MVGNLTLCCYSQDSNEQVRSQVSKKTRTKSPCARQGKQGASWYNDHTEKMVNVDALYKQIHDKQGDGLTW